MFFARNSRIGAVSTFVYLRLSVLILNGDFLRYSSTAKITISRRLLRNRHYSPLPTRILRSILGSLYHYGEIGTDGYRWAEPGSEGDLVRWKLGTHCLRNSLVSIRCCLLGVESSGRYGWWFYDLRTELCVCELTTRSAVVLRVIAV